MTRYCIASKNSVMIRNTTALQKATTGLAGAVAIAGGTAAYGQIIVVSTPADFVVSAGTATAPSVNWDVNGDGINDFTFGYRYPNTATGSGVIWQANMNPFTGSAATNGVIGYTGPFIRYGSALAAGFSIGTGGAFSTVTQVALGSRYLSGGVPTYYGGFAASIAPGTLAYAGFRFNDSGGQVHYGWILLSVGPGSIDFVSAAYQSTSNTAILAGAVPEPGTMAALAIGAVGVVGAVVRRRRQAA